MAALAALPASFLTIRGLLHTSAAQRFASAPQEDRWHTRSTPLLGGIGLFAGLLAAVGIALAAGLINPSAKLGGILGGCGIVFLAGLVDDLYRLSPLAKIAAQGAATALVLVSGVRVEIVGNPILATLLGVVWLIGMTNAFNLLDNMDGLSAGTAVIAAGFLFAFSVEVGNPALAVLCVALGGGALGFLLYNFNPARIFMGDSGSMYLGFTLSGITLLGSSNMAPDILFVLLVPAAMMGLPIFDTTVSFTFPSFI